MKHLLTTLFLLFAMTSIYGQSEKDTIYLDRKWEETVDMNQAKYYRLVEKVSNLYLVKDYFLNTHQLQMVGSFSDEKLTISNGDFTYYEQDSTSYFLSREVTFIKGKINGLDKFYYETGELYYTYAYNFGYLDGDFLGYYKNGQIKRKETFVYDKQKSKACYSPAGKKVKYYPFEVAAEFKGGIEALRKFIAANIEYPEYATEHKIEGKVHVMFVIDEQGFVSDVNILQSAHELFDKEAIRVIYSMPQWKPAEFDGEKVKSYYTLPINFKLDNPF